jgi:rhodanese-related sulfurtransferase
MPEEHSYRSSCLSTLRQTGAILLIASVVGLTVNYFRHDRLPLVATQTALTPSTSSTGADLTVSLKEAGFLFFSHEAVFIDARPEVDFHLGHIPGAISLPWEDFEARFQEAMAGVPSDSAVVTYCDGEACNLSHELTFALIGKGYSQTRVLQNGWTLWQQAGFPTEN